MLKRQLRLTRFHIVEFLKVPYFPMLMVISALSVLATQALAFHAWGGNPWNAWVRSGIIGMWTTSTAAAGILGFERYKGTLVYLVTSKINSFAPLIAVVSAASISGILSFAVAWLGWGIFSLTYPVNWGKPAITMSTFFAAIVLLWIATLVVTLAIAGIFILTPNALVYEELLLIPVFIISGITFTSGELPGIISFLSLLIPISAPSQIILGMIPEERILTILTSGIIVTTIWLAIAYRIGKLALKRAQINGTLDIL